MPPKRAGRSNDTAASLAFCAPERTHNACNTAWSFCSLRQAWRLTFVSGATFNSSQCARAPLFKHTATGSLVIRWSDCTAPLAGPLLVEVTWAAANLPHVALNLSRARCLHIRQEGAFIQTQQLRNRRVVYSKQYVYTYIFKPRTCVFFGHLTQRACKSEQQHVVILVRNQGLSQLDQNNMR